MLLAWCFIRGLVTTLSILVSVFATKIAVLDVSDAWFGIGGLRGFSLRWRCGLNCGFGAVWLAR